MGLHCETLDEQEFKPTFLVLHQKKQRNPESACCSSKLDRLESHRLQVNVDLSLGAEQCTAFSLAQCVL
jgi:hypothetical protein